MFAYFYNIKTHKMSYIDQDKARLAKLRTTIFKWAEAVANYKLTHPVSLLMIGLTYKPSLEPKPADISEFLKLVKKKLKSDLYAFAWVAELQGAHDFKGNLKPKGGKLHYHILLAINPKAFLPTPDKGKHPMWKLGSTNIKRARSPYYLVSYLKKKYQKDFSKFPKGFNAFRASVRFPGNTFKQDLHQDYHKAKLCSCGQKASNLSYMGATNDYNPARMKMKPFAQGSPMESTPKEI